jgi:hypothetical protein
MYFFKIADVVAEVESTRDNNEPVKARTSHRGE